MTEEKMMQKNDPTRLGRERIGKLLVEFAIPAVIGMAFNTLYNIIDTAFLQHSVGDAGAAVATLAFPVMTLLLGLALLAGQGGNALAAIQMGEGDFCSCCNCFRLRHRFHFGSHIDPC